MKACSPDLMPRSIASRVRASRCFYVSSSPSQSQACLSSKYDCAAARPSFRKASITSCAAWRRRSANVDLCECDTAVTYFLQGVGEPGLGDGWTGFGAKALRSGSAASSIRFKLGSATPYEQWPFGKSGYFSMTARDTTSASPYLSLRCKGSACSSKASGDAFTE